MGKKFKNVSDMIRSLSEREEFKNDSLKLIRRRRLSKFLFFLRCERNLTQKELADRLRCSQSRISKIESSDDESLTVKDFLDYAKVLDLQLEIGYRKKSVKIVDLIKYHAFKIDGYLKQLTGLAKAKDDETLIKGVSNFFKEALMNISYLIVKNLATLSEGKKIKEQSKEPIHISPPIDDKVIEKNSLAETKT